MFNDGNLQAKTEKFPQEIIMGFKKSTKRNYVSFDNINYNHTSKVDFEGTHGLMF